MTVAWIAMAVCPATGQPPLVIGKEALLPVDSRLLHSVIVNCAPGDGTVATVNPPRFRWYYVPDPARLTYRTRALYRFRLQIATTDEFDDPLVDVETDLNFYNELAPLKEGRTYYWRVGYLCKMISWDGRTVQRPQQTQPGRWSATRRFTVAPDTPTWDRSLLRDPPLGDHPRLLFRDDQLRRLAGRIRSDPQLMKVYRKNILKPARRIASTPAWSNWPTTDTGTEVENYYRAGRDLMRAAFAYKVMGRREFHPVVDIFATIAAYPPGGRSSPEGMGGDAAEDSTSMTEFLALAYDWFYHELTEPQRRAFERSLEWRIEKWMHEFRWGGSWYTRFRRGGYVGPAVSPVCLQLSGGDHNWEGSMATLPAAIAIYEKSPVAREYFHLVVNYLIGVGERAAQSGCPDQGLSYGLSHLKWLMYQTYYLNAALAELNIEKNPLYSSAGRFYQALTPLGLSTAPWGRGDATGAFVAHRSEVLGLLGRVTGDTDLYRSWQLTGGGRSYTWRPWVSLSADVHYPRPRDRADRPPRRFVFPQAGWVMNHSVPPTERSAFERGVGVMFVCRPSHRQNAFFGNNSFQFYAWGQTLNHGGGGAEDPLPFHSMSHNTVLVDGIGQTFGGPDRFSLPVRGRLIAYRRTPKAVYWCADATRWYPHHPFEVSTWKLVFDPRIYGRRDVRHLRRFRRHMLLVRDRYLVIFDDLQTAPGRPARFTWTYHILQDGPLVGDGLTESMRYSAGDVGVLLRHAANVEAIEFRDLPHLGWVRNPLTGEDYSTNKHTRRQVVENPSAKRYIPAHNLWFTSKKPAESFHFLVTIYPVRPGEPAATITPLDEWTVRIESEQAIDVISFDPDTEHPATIIVDLFSLNGAEQAQVLSQKQRGLPARDRVSVPQCNH